MEIVNIRAVRVAPSVSPLSAGELDSPEVSRVLEKVRMVDGCPLALHYST